MTIRRGFTLVELLVAMALSTILIGVMAATFQYVSRAHDTTVSRLDAARASAAALERLERDWRLAVAAPDPAAPGLEVSLAATPVVLEGQPLRHDLLSLVVLEPVDLDRDGAPDATQVSRVRWQVEWDAAREEGVLVRTASPASLPGAPGLPTLPADVREDVLRAVVEARFLPWLDAPPAPEAFRDPPAPADLPALRARLLRQGSDGALASYELCTPAPLGGIDPGALVRLEDTRTPPRFDEGLYTVRLRQVSADPSLPPHRLVLTTPPGDAPGGVRYTAAWLPPALFAALDVRARGPRGPVVRRTGRVLLRDTPGPTLVAPGGP